MTPELGFVESIILAIIIMGFLAIGFALMYNVVDKLNLHYNYKPISSIGNAIISLNMALREMKKGG